MMNQRPFSEIQTGCSTSSRWSLRCYCALIVAAFMCSGVFVNIGFGADEIAESLEADKQDYIAECEAAHEELLAEIDRMIEIFEKRSTGNLDEQLATLKHLRAEKENCENDHTHLPESSVLFKVVRSYKSKRDRAEKGVMGDFRAAAKRYHRAGDLQSAKQTLEAVEEFLKAANAKVTDAEIDFSTDTVITKFANGERVFSNRGYIWQDLEPDTPFSQATLDTGSSQASVSFNVSSEGNVFIAVTPDVVVRLQEDGWHLTDLTAPYNDNMRTVMQILRRKFATGRHTIPDTGWAGPIVLLP